MTTQANLNDIYYNEKRTIVGFPDYKVTSDGRIFSYRRGYEYELKLSLDSYGYLVVGLQNGKSRVTRKVHRLVASAFLGEDDRQINHKDCNKQNNQIENLEYCTPLENTKHAWANGRNDNNGSAVSRAWKDGRMQGSIEATKQRWKDGKMSCAAEAVRRAWKDGKMCHVAEAVSKSWKDGKHINSILACRGENCHNSKLTEEQAQQILDFKGTGIKQVEIASYFNVSKATVNDIFLRKTWKHLTPSVKPTLTLVEAS